MLLALTDDAGSLVGGMPLMDLRGWLRGRRFVSLPFSDYTPMLARNDGDRQKIIAGVFDLLAARGVDRCDLHAGLTDRGDVEERQGAIGVNGLYDIPSGLRHESSLGGDLSLNYERFHRTRVRQPIEHAVSLGVRVERAEGLDGMRDYYRLHVATRRRHGLPPQPWRFFQLIHERMFGAGLGALFLARSEGRVIAGSIFLGWGSRLVYKFNASDPVYWKLSANHLLLWQAIQWGGANGYTTLDWGRTEIEHTGLRDFKRGFGTDEIPLHYSLITRVPPRSDPSGRSSKSTPEWGATLIRHAPLWFCRGVGRVLYGQFG